MNTGRWCSFHICSSSAIQFHLLFSLYLQAAMFPMSLEHVEGYGFMANECLVTYQDVENMKHTSYKKLRSRNVSMCRALLIKRSLPRLEEMSLKSPAGDEDDLSRSDSLDPLSCTSFSFHHQPVAEPGDAFGDAWSSAMNLVPYEPSVALSEQQELHQSLLEPSTSTSPSSTFCSSLSCMSVSPSFSFGAKFAANQLPAFPGNDTNSSFDMCDLGDISHANVCDPPLSDAPFCTSDDDGEDEDNDESAYSMANDMDLASTTSPALCSSPEPSITETFSKLSATPFPTSLDLGPAVSDPDLARPSSLAAAHLARVFDGETGHCIPDTELGLDAAGNLMNEETNSKHSMNPASPKRRHQEAVLFPCLSFGEEEPLWFHDTTTDGSDEPPCKLSRSSSPCRLEDICCSSRDVASRSVFTLV
eukprot:m.105487 g.105487  ORF g.105487 m.105487 type:complete len:418 (+) comp15117_c0_seq1:614-1867(+)